MDEGRWNPSDVIFPCCMRDDGTPQMSSSPVVWVTVEPLRCYLPLLDEGRWNPSDVVDTCWMSDSGIPQMSSSPDGWVKVEPFGCHLPLLDEGRWNPSDVWWLLMDEGRWNPSDVWWQLMDEGRWNPSDVVDTCWMRDGGTPQMLPSPVGWGTMEPLKLYSDKLKRLKFLV